ncbi:MAG: S9 family peptidase [Alphaproteobacteria bacterium]|nr:S9 family peptidase [Alphaproteobacteria bacterium]
MQRKFGKAITFAVLLPLMCVTVSYSAPVAKRVAAHTAKAEGALDTSVDTESRDVTVQLRSLEQEVYITQQYLYLLLFRQQFAGRITADRVNIANVDGGGTPAYVFAPAVLEKNRQYPGLVIVHGSYHGSLDPSIFELIATAVDKGYIVIFPEYRGSRGYGQAHYDAIDFGGKEVDDVEAAADYLAQTRPVPRDRIGIYGRSKGGMVTLLAIERFPKSFKAAVDVVGLTDMIAYMAYKPGFRGEDVAKQPRFGGKTIQQDAAPYIDVSPLNHVDAIETPLLIHATTGDKTAPVQLHSGRLIEVLKAHGKGFESKIYDMAPGGHLYSEVDTPQARDSEQRIFEFLAKYLQPTPPTP